MVTSVIFCLIKYKKPKGEEMEKTKNSKKMFCAWTDRKLNIVKIATIEINMPQSQTAKFHRKNASLFQSSAAAERCRDKINAEGINQPFYVM
jgi:hypothetical protein